MVYHYRIGKSICSSSVAKMKVKQCNIVCTLLCLTFLYTVKWWYIIIELGIQFAPQHWLSKLKVKQCNTFHCLTFINCHKIEIDYFRKSSYSHVSPTPVEVNDDATVTSNNGNNPNSINATEQAATNISSSSQTRRNSQVNMRLLN